MIRGNAATLGGGRNGAGLALSPTLTQLTINRPWLAYRVKSIFSPENLGDWLYNRMQDWCAETGASNAAVHVFRKTHLQAAVDGDEGADVASDAAVSLKVMNDHYLTRDDRRFRSRSNRIYARLVNELPVPVLQAYGLPSDPSTPEDRLRRQLREAESKSDWQEVARIAGLLNDCA